ncbi:TonB-dependent receptor domain-containing protein [Phenylobacterium terrae]|uniref:TonB-dependent receptor domain-containing protein n=1 Tax=Phenylobacterium terrae TaxID=2665495 RepID=A0ABW4N5F5_9CAUL
MTRSRFFCSGSAFAVALSLGLAGTAYAQDEGVAEVEEVVVTGSFIAGTPEDAALPVDVISSDELQRQGSPSTTDLIKSIPAVQGVAGETNQFRAGQSTGTSNVNLRGLGPLRTLVLLNGRRVAPSPAAGIGIDINLFPVSAIGRVEVLKEGAAATYGSDAIGGVVNFITKKLDGFEVGGQYSLIPGSDGEYSMFANYGWRGERGSVLLSAGYRHRDELPVTERDFAMPDFDVNPGGGWSSFGNPGAYFIPGNAAAGFPTTTRFADPNCAALGNDPRIAASGETCYFQFGRFNNLIEEEDHYQLYGEVNFDLTDSVQFHGEALWASHDVPRENSSPSYAPVTSPTASAGALVPGFFYIPSTNPGLQALLPQLTAAQQAQIAASPLRGIITTGLAWRPYGAGGNPLTGESKHDRRYFEGWRVSGGFKGELENGIGWDVALTYSVNESEISTPDIVTNRLQLALRGLGGPGCNPATGTPGVGPCMWFNPFSTGIARNAATGEVNPNYVAGSPAAQANSREVADWMFEDYGYNSRADLFVADAVVNGKFDSLNLAGGDIGWALGAQYRVQGFERRVNNISNADINPCIEEGVTNCPTSQQFGPLSFFGGLTNQAFDSSVWAVFGELQVPFTDTIDMQLALRHEDYGGNVGSTTNPKIALRWQATDWLALRAAAGSTFRAPPQAQLLPDATTNLTFTSEAGGYRPYDVFGNPNLDPETADTFSLGAIFEMGPVNATLDYWRFDFGNPIGNESGTRMFATLIQGGCNFPAAFLARFTAATATPIGPGAGCTAANVARTRVNTINGAEIQTSGLDGSIVARFDDVWGGRVRVGADVTYVFEYEVGAMMVEGVEVIPANDYAGHSDLTHGSQPQWRGNVYAEYNTGAHNVRWTIRYIDNMIDTRNGSFGGTNIFGLGTSGFPVTGGLVAAGAKIDSFVTHDLTYRGELPWDVTLTAAVINVFDEEPPFARYDLSYDPYTANPLGRYFKIGLTKRF